MKKIIGIGIIMFLFVVSVVNADLTWGTVQNLQVRNGTTWDLYDPDQYFVNQDPDPGEPGGYVDIRFKVENIGYDTSDDVVFEILPVYPFSLYEKESAVKYIGDIEAKQVGEDAYIIKYRLKVDKDAVEGDNVIRFRYSTDGGVTWIQPDPFYISIRTHDAIVAVESVSIEPELVAQGEKARISIGIKNMADSIIQDLKISLQLIRVSSSATSVTYEELPFTPIGSTNEKTIDQINGGEQRVIEFDIITDADADSGAYKLPIDITYNDRIGINYSTSSIIGVVLGSEPDLSVWLDSSTITKAGMRGEVTIRVVNKGVSDIKFLNVKMAKKSDYSIISPEEVYIGNIDSDDYETADFEIFVKETATGDVDLPLNIEYMDANNKKYSAEKTIYLKIGEDSENLGAEKKSGWIILVIFLVIVGGGLFVYIKIRKRKKR